jgi:SPP1 gp7 family putative phage head morphogenesis protein
VIEDKVEPRPEREKFSKARNAQASYGAALRQYARQIARIVEHYSENGIVPAHKQHALAEMLRRYADGTREWARATAWRMLKEVEKRNLTAWKLHTEEMSRALRHELLTAPTGETMLDLLAEQVDLITSLPKDAAERVQETSMAALETSARYPERYGEIAEALEVAHPEATASWLKNRATLIARTETARSASVLVQARAEYVGADSYIWETAGDWKVRPSHKRLNHTVQKWSEPPLSDPPDYHSHPGQIFNCRCVALPIIPEGG